MTSVLQLREMALTSRDKPTLRGLCPTLSPSPETGVPPAVLDPPSTCNGARPSSAFIPKSTLVQLPLPAFLLSCLLAQGFLNFNTHKSSAAFVKMWLLIP